MSSDPARPANRLATQSSPYLLQHAHNPVDWHPWGPEALARARETQRPIFLSIGYSTCHWCHVMERESFENERVAAVLNEHFVPIKVDREERPDLDKIYMTAVQMMGLGGGWPLSVWLTPDLEPFHGGTYFPPESAHGRMGFRELLLRIAAIWDGERERLTRSAAEITARLHEVTAVEPDPGQVLAPALLERGARQLAGSYDPQHGGFGSAPKFPRPSTPRLLVREAARTGQARLRGLVTHTLVRMAHGGIYDQLGGGFARYSVDERWLVPHFEKMLYDQAQLVQLALDLWQCGEERPLFARIARETCEYVLRDLRDDGGAFLSAEDADSEGREGTFYVWSPEQVRAVLGEPLATFAQHRLGITDAGNFSDHSASGPQPPSQNVISLVRSVEDAAARAGLDPATADAAWTEVRRRLFEAREQRPRPHRDDKVLTNWNGLMIGAMARAGALLGEVHFVTAAARAARFLRDTQWDGATRRLRHSWRAGKSDATLLLDDHAFLIDGLLDLHQATLDPEWLGWARELADVMLERFEDAEAGGFYQSAAGDDSLLLRVKEDYDGAEPSGNSVAALALIRLDALIGEPRHRTAAERTLRLLSTRMARLPEAVPHALLALDALLAPSEHLVLAGDPASDDFRALLAVARERYRPNLVVVHASESAPAWARGMAPLDGRATAFYCRDRSCRLPVTEPAALAAQMDT